MILDRSRSSSLPLLGETRQDTLWMTSMSISPVNNFIGFLFLTALEAAVARLLEEVSRVSQFPRVVEGGEAQNIP